MPAVGRRTAGVLDTLGPLRVGVLNAGVLLLALPGAGLAPLAWALIAAAVAGFVVLAVTATLVRARAG